MSYSFSIKIADYIDTDAVYDHIIKIDAEKDCKLIQQWCMNKFGNQGGDWASFTIRNIISSSKLQTIKPHEFYFKNESDAVLFELTWGGV